MCQENVCAQSWDLWLRFRGGILLCSGPWVGFAFWRTPALLQPWPEDCTPQACVHSCIPTALTLSRCWANVQ